jgi:hypothetical protein
MFYSEEYKHLLLAERAMSTAIDSVEAKPSDIAQLARALVAVIDQKRAIRGVPDPKPIDTTLKRKPKLEEKQQSWRKPGRAKPQVVLMPNQDATGASIVEPPADQQPKPNAS